MKTSWLPSRAASVPAAALMVLGLCAPVLKAQTLYGSLIGNVTDPSGADLPSVKVSAVNTDTGFTREVVANDRGAYRIPDLQAGHYDVTVTSPSFATFVQRGVLVSNNAVIRVDVQMQLSSSAEKVTVTGSAETLQTDRADVRSELNTKQLTDLPCRRRAKLPVAPQTCSWI